MFMYHENTENLGDGRRYATGWREIYTPSAGEVASLITKYACSSCCWKGGVRNKSSFVYAEWLGLDFDEGMTLDEAITTFEPFMHVIGTTKSHRKMKGGKQCDRYRVFLRLLDRIKSKDDYEETVKSFIKKYGADKQCNDASRFFWPCQEVVVSKYHGTPVATVKYDTEKDKMTNLWLKKRNAKLNAHYVGGKVIPPWSRMVLDHGCPDGSRTEHCYMVGRDLGRVGYSESEAVEIIWNSRIPYDSSDKCYKDVRKAVRSGFSKPF